MSTKEIGDLGLIKEKINKCITEELGISDEVERWSKDLGNIIISKLKTSQWETYRNGNRYINGIKRAYFEFEFPFEKNNLNIGVEAFNFKDKYVRNEWKDVFPYNWNNNATSGYGNSKIDDEFNVMLNFIKVPVMLISGKIDTISLYKCISHEFRHVYEQMKNNNSSFSNRYDNVIYGKCVDLYNENPLNSPKSNVGLIGYMSFDYERRAFIEELFNSVINKIKYEKKANPFELCNYLYNNNEVLKNISIMEYTLDELKAHDNIYVSIVEDLLSDTKFTLEQFVERCTNALSDFIRRYGRCVVKIQKDYPIIFKNTKSKIITTENRNKPYCEYFI